MADQTKTFACPSPDVLQSFSTGDLPDNQLEEIADHLSTCAECETQLDTVGESDPTVVSVLRVVQQQWAGADGEQLHDEPSCHELSRRLTMLGYASLFEHPAATEGGARSVTRSWAIHESADTGQEGIPEKIGQYFVLRELGHGGFSVVYLARDPDKNRHVAIKVPRRDRPMSDDRIQRFLEEARTAAEMDYPGIVPVYDWGRDDQVDCYVVMQYIEGRSLDEVCEAEKLGVSQAVEIVSSVAESLHYAHSHGVVHRDIKPANIIIDNSGAAHVADFGLALNEQTQVLIGGELAGTYPYMSPEQLRGEGQQIDGRTDVWSLGVVLYELLTGRRPFQGKTTSAIAKSIVKNEPRALRQIKQQIPEPLEQVCLRALSKQKGDRYSTARDFAAALKPWRRSRVAGRRRIILASLAALLVLSAIAFIANGVAPSRFRSSIASGVNADSFRIRPMVAMDLLEREPVELVNELEDPWQYDKAKRQVKVDTRDSIILLEVNRTDFHPFRLEVRFEQIEPAYDEGMFAFGVFFGLHQDLTPEGINCDKYQILRVVRAARGNQYGLERIKSLHYVDRFGNLVSEDALITGSESVGREENISFKNDRKDLLTLEVGRSGLEQVTWRGQKMRGLTDPELNDLTTTSDYEGAMGIVMQRGQATVTSVRFTYLDNRE